MLENIPEIYIQRLVFSSLVFIGAYVAALFIKRSVDLVVIGVKKRVTTDMALARTRTIRNLLKNAIDVAVYVIALLVILEKWGVDTRPILTGAGLIGLAFSFGSQSIVKDFISGFFIIAENLFNLGDRVKIGSDMGIVKQITLRMTVLEDEEGNVVYIPNSQVNAVTRYKDNTFNVVKKSRK
jgi:small conductance mechanosensitive channel